MIIKKTHENVNISKTMIMGDKKEVVLYYKAAIGSNELIWIK